MNRGTTKGADVGFRVDETALDGAADRLTALGPAVGEAETYVARHLKLSGIGDSGIFVSAIGTLDDIRGAMEDELAHLRQLTLASADELRATAADYRATDDATDAAMDALYEQAPPPPSRVRTPHGVI